MESDELWKRVLNLIINGIPSILINGEGANSDNKMF